MPVYQCYSPKGLLTKPVKAKIAEEITSIHCNATGAPELYVNVLFQDISEHDCFVAGQPATHSYIFGAIRHGRHLEIRQVPSEDFQVKERSLIHRPFTRHHCTPLCFPCRDAAASTMRPRGESR